MDYDDCPNSHSRGIVFGATYVIILLDVNVYFFLLLSFLHFSFFIFPVKLIYLLPIYLPTYLP